MQISISAQCRRQKLLINPPVEGWCKFICSTLDAPGSYPEFGEANAKFSGFQSYADGSENCPDVSLHIFVTSVVGRSQKKFEGAAERVAKALVEVIAAADADVMITANGDNFHYRHER